MDIKEYWMSRRTVRNFSDRVVDDSLIKSIVERAAHAPNTGNMQLYSVVVSRDPEQLRRLAPAHFSQPAMTNAPVVLTFCADYNRFIKWCEASDAVPGYDNFQSFVAAMIDAVIFAQQFCTIAELEGLGCCYLGTTTYNAPQIADVLRLPEMVVPVVSLSLGYPAGDSPASDRLPVEAIIHNEVYRDESAADVKAYYAEKEALDENRKFVDENGKTTLAQVFTDIRYTKEAGEHFSKVFADFIEKQGYKRQ